MKHCLFVVILLHTFFACFAQSAGADSSFRPKIFYPRWGIFQAAPNSESDVIMLGDSITDWVNWNELFQSPYVRNRGIAGDNTSGVLERLGEVTEGKPSKVFLKIGINDITRGYTVASIAKNYRKIVQRIKKESPRTKIYVQTILPKNGGSNDLSEAVITERILEVNRHIRQIAKDENVQLIDTYSHFATSSNRLIKEFTYDGLHLNAAGYEHWKKMIISEIRPPQLEHPRFNQEGHRGIRGLLPENVIPSMYLAIDHGAHTIEVDVVISKDKKVVVSHDVYFHADFTTTPEGDTLTARDASSRLLYKMPYDSIRKYDVGLKKNRAFAKQQPMPAYKPLLSELIDSVEAYCARKGKQVIYNIEIKASADYDGIKQPVVNETADLVMQVVRSRKLEKKAYLQSFDFRIMQIINRKYPEMETAILIGGNEKRSLADQITDLGYTPGIYSPHFSLVTRKLVDDCHARGMRIIPWTVNTKDDMHRLITLGVDGIITDYANYFSEL